MVQFVQDPSLVRTNSTTKVLGGNVDYSVTVPVQVALRQELVAVVSTVVPGTVQHNVVNVILLRTILAPHFRVLFRHHTHRPLSAIGMIFPK